MNKMTILINFEFFFGLDDYFVYLSIYFVSILKGHMNF